MNVVADMEKIPYETSDKQAAIINLVFNSYTFIYYCKYYDSSFIMRKNV